VAKAVRYAIIIAALLLAAWVLESMASAWAWLPAIAICLGGAILAEVVFRRLAPPKPDGPDNRGGDAQR
jgi:hypothetical protein